ncbi:double zinc ribbon domain-containing protein [Bacillaceae bacterium W0354]
MNELIDQKIDQLRKDKAKLLSQLGQSIYHQYRVGNIYSEELKEFADQILKIDKKLYEMIVEEREGNAHFLRCECGNLLEQDDRYCGKCGKEVNIDNNHVTSRCAKCQVELVMHSKFCHVCGTRQNNE